MSTFDLERFISAQELVYSTVVGELRNGMKASHWMWFIFPQIDGLGSARQRGTTRSARSTRPTLTSLTRSSDHA